MTNKTTTTTKTDDHESHHTSHRQHLFDRGSSGSLPLLFRSGNRPTLDRFLISLDNPLWRLYVCCPPSAAEQIPLGQQRYIILYCAVLFCIVLYCIALYRTTLCCIVLYCIVSYRIVLEHTVLRCIVPHCVVPVSYTHLTLPTTGDV